uniref:Uncharacterized protein n=2 Tax=Picea TaxID=3328 RepID=A0A101LZR5_PICGL|nr:hypothetical protein ABT39_MTgene5376 [Picea glauca]QHR90237.1 hypothetical protein Q903MT_gene4260 [Picea sitchensis]
MNSSYLGTTLGLFHFTLPTLLPYLAFISLLPTGHPLRSLYQPYSLTQLTDAPHLLHCTGYRAFGRASRQH